MTALISLWSRSLNISRNCCQRLAAHRIRYASSAARVTSSQSRSPRLFVQGVGSFGSLGTGDFSDRDNYVELILPDGMKPKAISAGYGHSGVVTACGRLFVTGITAEFRRVIRISSIRDTNKHFATLVAKAFRLMGGDCLSEPTLLCDNVDTVSCSGCLTVVQSMDGTVRCIGYNPYGQAGVDPEQTESKVGKEIVAYLNPISTLPLSKMIDTGLQHVISLSRDGDVYTWGKGGNGQLGNEKHAHSHIPVLVDIKNKCTKVAAGFAHSAAICEEGKLYIWGKGCSDKKFEEKEQAKFSVLRYQDKLIPREVKLPGKRKAIDLMTSYYSTIVVASDMSVWAMGLGEYDRKPLYDLQRVENDLEKKGYLQLSPGYKLCKGGKRVTIIKPTPDGVPLDVILHEEEAYTRRASLAFENPADANVDSILNMSSSINHSLTIVQ